MRQPVAALENCRIDVARWQKPALEPGRGRARDPALDDPADGRDRRQIEVKPLDPLDSYVLDCVKSSDGAVDLREAALGDRSPWSQPFAFR